MPPRKQQTPAKAPRKAAANLRKAVAKTAEVAALSRGVRRFPIVGIGGSAGGLDAYQRFFEHMPPDSGMAFILVSHLDPTHASMMPELLRKHTKMAVVEAKDGMKVEPNHVYLIPPNKNLAILKRTLQLIESVDEVGVRLPIDYFFRSLAQDQRENAIGIVFSGMGTDGTAGLRAIKGEFGMVVAQEPVTARSDSMPRSAIATGLVDYILPPEKMPEQIIRYVKRTGQIRGPRLGTAEDSLSDDVQKICILLRSHTGHDFSSYKPTTINRRIARRMDIQQIDRAARYVRYLQDNPRELDTLFRELLIGVTSFFRDREAFQALKTKALPELFRDKPKNYSFRVWVPGCSTGEEAYSIAILFQEHMNKIRRAYDVQIFATDIDEQAIDTARVGAYPANISADISPERLNRFFVKSDGIYRVKKDIRDMLVLAVQDLIKDPPFTRLDLVSCRNLLIYLHAAVQQKLLPLFHYSLRPNGVLFLGSSETVGASADFFSVVDRKAKIYRRREVAPSLPFALAEFDMPAVQDAAQEPAAKQGAVDVSQLSDRMLLQNYAPASLVVNDKGDIFHIHGRTGRFLEPSSGKARMNAIEMAREGLKLELSSTLSRVVARKKAISRKRVRVRTNSDFEHVDLTVLPLKTLQEGRGLFMVIFEEEVSAPERPPTAKRGAKRGRTPPEQGRVEELELDLANTKETLQTTIEELQTSNEELKSMNEELQSTNEELQSSNEELETSKEELQSLHEEVLTVNAELESKLAQLSAAHNDMKNLLDSTEIPTIFLDNEMRIRNFSHNATAIVNLIHADIGRPMQHLVPNLKYETLVDDATNVLRRLMRIEKEVETNEGHWYLMRILPYRTLENTIDGVVITFLDNHAQHSATEEVKRLNEELSGARDLAEGIVDTVGESLLVLDSEIRVVSANRSFYSTFQMRPEETKGRTLFELGNREWDIPELRRLLEEVLPKNNVFDNFTVTHEFPNVGVRQLRLNARRINRQQKPLILLAIEESGNGETTSNC